MLSSRLELIIDVVDAGVAALEGTDFSLREFFVMYSMRHAR